MFSSNVGVLRLCLVSFGILQSFLTCPFFPQFQHFTFFHPLDLDLVCPCSILALSWVLPLENRASFEEDPWYVFYLESSKINAVTTSSKTNFPLGAELLTTIISWSQLFGKEHSNPHYYFPQCNNLLNPQKIDHVTSVPLLNDLMCVCMHRSSSSSTPYLTSPIIGFTHMWLILTCVATLHFSFSLTFHPLIFPLLLYLPKLLHLPISWASICMIT